jgi:anaerobic C4-dicarboxylate transporter
MLVVHHHLVGIVAPLRSYKFTFLAGKGISTVRKVPALHEVVHQNDIRVERSMAIATIASQQSFGFGLFFAPVLLCSQVATSPALMRPGCRPS